MNFADILLRIKYVDEGYLPYWPFHLISDDEMLNAAREYIQYIYQCPDDYIKDKYDAVMIRLITILDRYQDKDYYNKYDPEDYGMKPEEIPDWIYSFLMGKVISNSSNYRDVHDLLVLLELDNYYDMMDDEIYNAVYDISKKYLGKYPEEYSNWDMFWFSQYHPELVEEQIEKPQFKILGGESFDVRPPSIFGEPHVIRALRLEQVAI